VDGEARFTFDPPEPGLNESGGWYVAYVGSGVAVGPGHGCVSSPNSLSLTADYRRYAHGDAAAGVEQGGLAVGVPHSFGASVKDDETIPAIGLFVRIYDHDLSGWYGRLLAEFVAQDDPLCVGWRSWLPGGFTPITPNVIIEAIARDPNATRDTFGTWSVDNVTISWSGGVGA
jgi:hypothetical protein